MSGLDGATVVLTTTSGGETCPASLTFTVVSLNAPLAAAPFALTVTIAVPAAPGARVRLIGNRVEALKSVLFESPTLILKVLELQTDVSVFLTVTVYAAVPPAVIVCAEGETTIFGVLTIQIEGSSVVVTLFDVLFAWFVLAAVTLDVRLPDV